MASSSKKLKLCKKAVIVYIQIDDHLYGMYYNKDAKSSPKSSDNAFAPETGIFSDTELDYPTETTNGWTEINSDDVTRITKEEWCKVITLYL